MLRLNGRVRVATALTRRRARRVAAPWNCVAVMEVMCDTEATTARIRALAASPPKLPGVMSRTATPEVCLAVPKTRRRRRRRPDDGDGFGGGDGGDYGSWVDEEWHGDDGDRFWMWLVLMVYSIIQGMLLINKPHKSTPSTFFAAITFPFHMPK